MNITQAKTIAGIKYRLSTREDYQRAEKDSVKLITAARRASDDNRAAELSEAKSFFQKWARTPDRCPVCDAKLSRGAEYCRIHSRSAKAIAAPIGLKQTAKRNGNARVGITCEPHVALGYHTPPVQKVVAKWRKEIGESFLERYFLAVADPVVWRRGTLKLPEFISPNHWHAVFELGAAIAKVCADKSKIDAWILGGEATENYGYDSLREIRARIIKQGGKPFSTAAIAKRFHDLKLSTSTVIAKDYRSFVITKTG